MGDSLVIGSLAIEDVTDVGEQHSKPVAAELSITGSKIVQINNNPSAVTGETLAYSIRVHQTEYAHLLSLLQAGNVLGVSLYDGTDLLKANTGILTKVSAKRLHPTEWVDATIAIIIIT